MATETLTQVHRSIFLIGATGTIRTAVFQEREHLVVPVVALVEGVLWPVNAEHPELVLYEEFSESPQLWNGRPVVYGHPMINGLAVSANDPKILEGWAFGNIFNTVVNAENKSLGMEAWIDPVRATRIGAQELVDRINTGKMIEISVGVFTKEQKKSGEYNGKHYDGIWREPGPDHLALLPEGYIGACSNEMGCGAPRVAVAHLVTNKGFISLSRMEEPQVTETKEEVKPEKKSSPFSRVLKAIGNVLRATEGESISELYNGLHDALHATEPGYMWIDEVWPDEGRVAYWTRPEDKDLLFERKFSIDKGKVTLDSEKTESKWVKKLEPVAAVSPQPATSSECGCGGVKAAESHSHKEDDAMKTKADRITALEAKKIPGVTKTFLETCTDAQLDSIEAETAKIAAPVETPAAPVVPVTPVVATTTPSPREAVEAVLREMSEDDFLKVAPKSIKDFVTRQKENEAKERTGLVTAMKTNQTVYTEAELIAMPIEQLRKTAKLCNADVPSVDFSGRGIPVGDAGNDNDQSKAPAPINLAERLKAARAVAK